MSTQVNVIQNDNQLTVNSVYNTITVIDNNREGHIVEVIQPISNVVTINTGFAGVAGPVGPAGPTGSSIPFSNKGGDVWFTTSSIEITGSLTISGSNTFKNIGPAIFSGSINVSGSTIFTGSVQGNLTGSLLGTASYASQALTASYALNVIDTTFPYTGSAIINGSLAVTGSTGISSTLNVGGQATFNSFAQFGNTIYANLSTWTIQNTANPGSLLLQSRGSAFNNFMFHTNGFLGINQLSPSMSLDVSGSGRFTNGLHLTGSLTTSGSLILTGSINASGNLFLSGSINMNDPAGSTRLDFKKGAVNAFFLNDGGSFAFGTGTAHGIEIYTNNTIINRVGSNGNWSFLYGTTTTGSVNISGSTVQTGSLLVYVTGSDKVNIGNAAVNGTSLGILRVGQGTTWLDFGQQTAGVPAIWMGKTPSNSNMSMYADATSTFLNAPTSVIISIGGASKHWFNSTGLRLGSTIAAPSSTLDVAGSSSFSGSMYISGSTYITGSLNILQDTGYITLGSLVGATSFGAIYIDKATPSVSNYSLISDTNETMLNGVTNVYLRTSNGTRLQANSTNVLITVPLVVTGSATISGSLNVTGSSILGTQNSDVVYLGNFNHQFTNVVMQAAGNANGYQITRVTATPTFPNYVINRADTTTGIGGSIGTVALIASGSSILTVTSSGVSITGSTTISGSLNVSGSQLNWGDLTVNAGNIKVTTSGSVDEYISFNRAGSNGWASGRSNTNARYVIAYNATGDATLSSSEYLGISNTGDVVIGRGAAVSGSLTVSGSTILSGSSTIITGSLLAYVTGSDFINLGNATPNPSSNLGILRIGQHTSVIDMGYIAGSQAAIWVQKTTPTTTNYTITADAATTIFNGVDNLIFSTAGTERFRVNRPQTSGVLSTFNWASVSDTGMTAGTNIPKYIFNGGSTQWLAGNLTNQYFYHFRGGTASFASGNNTITDVYNVYVGSTNIGTGATASANWAAGFEGNVNITAATPLLQLVSNANGIGCSFRNTAWSMNRNVNTGTIYNSSAHAYQFNQNQSADGAVDSLKLQVYTPAGGAVTSASIGVNGNGELLFIPGNTISRSSSIEYPSAKFSNFSRQWLVGDLTIQRERLFSAPTYSFSNSSTITASYNIYAIAPLMSTNATASNNYAAGFSGSIHLAQNNTGIYGLDSTGAHRLLLNFTNGDNININGRQGSTDIYLNPTSGNTGTVVKSTGAVGIYGVVSPTARLHIGAGGAGTGAAPLKLTPGSFQTNLESGSIEFNGNYLTITTGSTRNYILHSNNPYPITGSLLVTGSLTVSGSASFDGYFQYTTGSNRIVLRDTVGVPTYAALYMNVVPSSTNYLITSDGANPGINGTTGIAILTGGTTRINVRSNSLTFTPGVASGASVIPFNFTSSNNTNQDASTPVPKFYVSLAGTQWLAGNITSSQGFFQISQPTMSFTNQSTASMAATFRLIGGVSASTSASITENAALLIDSGSMGSSTERGYGALIYAPVSASISNAALGLRGNLIQTGSTYITGSLAITGSTNLISIHNTSGSSLRICDWAGNTTTYGYGIVSNHDSFKLPTTVYFGDSSYYVNRFLVGGSMYGGAFNTFKDFKAVSGNNNRIFIYGEDSTGNVGIGTTSPSHSLDVSGSGRYRNNLYVTGSLLVTGSLNITGSASYNNNTIATLPDVRFCVQMGSISFNPADATTYYDGMFIPNNSNHSQGAGKIYIPQNCTLIGYSLTLYNNGGVGTNEASSISCSINNSTLITLDNVMDVTKFPYTSSASNLNTNINAGDYVELRWTTPTWGTNPVSTAIAATLWFKGR